MNQEQYFSATLDCGLKIAHIPSRSNVAYCGLAVNIGTRDEEPSKLGLAHFLEHTIFKGTRKRRSWHIVNRMERVGGELNAYTSKEETMLYSVFPCENYPRALELIADLVQNSIFPEKEIEKEREVVIDEIASYRDIPAEAVYDDFEDLIFAGSGLGHNILGTAESVRSITPADCRQLLTEAYIPSNMVLFSMGNIPFDRLCRIANRYFNSPAGSYSHSLRTTPQTNPSFDLRENLGNHQAHTIVGYRTFGMHDQRRFALSLLNNILGGPGMNSILNIEMREKRGYVYTVESASTLYTDCGLLSIYFGCDEKDVDRCRKIAGKAIEDLSTYNLSARRLEMAKRQYLGQLIVAQDNCDSLALGFGKTMLFFGSYSSFDEITERINSLTADEIREAAISLGAPSTLTLL